MRPWTTRTLQVAVVAAGFAAAGTATASAEPADPIPTPDLTRIPDDVGFSVPVDACGPQDGAAFHAVKAPCADAGLRVSTPNVVKRVGADIVTTTHGMAGELRDGRPILAPGKPNRVLGHVFAETTRLKYMTKTRPTVEAEVRPEHTGVFDRHKPDSGLLDATIGPRQQDHQGVSAADTAVELTAVRGFEFEPVANPVGAAAPVLRDNPLHLSEGATLPKLGQLLPVANDMPALAMLDNGVAGAAKELTGKASTGVEQSPIGVDAESLPIVGDAADHLMD